MTQVNQEQEVLGAKDKNEKVCLATDVNEALKPSAMDSKEQSIEVSYDDLKGDQENHHSGGNIGRPHLNTTSANTGGYRKHNYHHNARFRPSQGYNNHNNGNNHRFPNNGGYNTGFHNQNGYHNNTNYGNTSRPYNSKRQFHNNDYYPAQTQHQSHMYAHQNHHHNGSGQHHGSSNYWSSGGNQYYPQEQNYSHQYYSRNGSNHSSRYLSSGGNTPETSSCSVSPDPAQLPVTAAAVPSTQMELPDDSGESSRLSSAEDDEAHLAKPSPDTESISSVSSVDSSKGSSLTSKSPTPCFPTPESLDTMLPSCVNPMSSSNQVLPGGGSTRHGGWGDSPEPHQYLGKGGHYAYPPPNGHLFYPASNLNDGNRHMTFPQFQPNPRYTRRDGPYEMYQTTPPYPYPNYFLGGLPCEPPHHMNGGPPMTSVFNPGPQFTFPDSVPLSNEPNKLVNLNEKTGVMEWTSCEDGNEIPRICSPGLLTIGTGPQGSLNNRPLSKRRPSIGAYGTQSSPTIGPNGYFRKPFHFQDRPQWQLSCLRAEDYLNNYNYVEEADKPERLTPVGSEWAKLSEQIWVKFQTNQQSKEMYKNKVELWRQLSEIVKTAHPSYSLEVVGSTVSGFGSNTSDVDMCLLLNNRIDQSDRDEALQILEKLGPKLKSIPNIENNEVIQAKVPILKFKDTVHNLDVDINVNNAVGLRNTQLLFGYAQCDWRVRPLILVVKLWANFQGINDAKSITLSSYSLSLMVIHYLQHGVTPAVLPCLQQSHPERFSSMVTVLKVRKSIIEPLLNHELSENTETLAELLLGFLEYFSVKFDYKTMAISVRTGSTISIRNCCYNKAPKNDPYQWKHMCIEEPFEFTNTARSVYERDSFDRVRGVFCASWQRLSKTRDLDSIFKPISPSEARLIGSKMRP